MLIIIRVGRMKLWFIFEWWDSILELLLVGNRVSVVE